MYRYCVLLNNVSIYFIFKKNSLNFKPEVYVDWFTRYCTVLYCTVYSVVLLTMARVCHFTPNIFKGFRECVQSPPPPPLDPSRTVPLMVSALSIAVIVLSLTLNGSGILRVGDAVNILVLINTAAFLFSVIANNTGLFDVGLSTSFNVDGFCVANKDTPFLQSHILCFYVDSACAIVLAVLARVHSNKVGLEPVKLAAAGVFVHGLAHLWLWHESNAIDPNEPTINSTNRFKLVSFVIAFLLFFLILRSFPSIPNKHAMLHSVVHGLVLEGFVPGRFGFTYVNTVIMALLVAYELLGRTKKDRFYDLSAVLINFPITQAAWLEGFTCDSFLKSVGGHVWYDSVIPLSMFMYYAVTLATQPTGNKLARA